MPARRRRQSFDAPKIFGTRRRPKGGDQDGARQRREPRMGERQSQRIAREAAAAQVRVGARSRARSTPWWKLSSTAFETFERSIRDRSFAPPCTALLYGTVRCCSARCG